MLKVKFDYKEEPLNEHLGVTYTFDLKRGICHMSQADHTLKFLKLFGHEDCKPSPFPTLDGPEPCDADCATKYKGSWDMESYNSNAIWLVVCTRSDIQKAVKPLSRFPKNFGDRHVQSAK